MCQEMFELADVLASRGMNGDDGEESRYLGDILTDTDAHNELNDG